MDKFRYYGYDRPKSARHSDQNTWAVAHVFAWRNEYFAPCSVFTRCDIVVFRPAGAWRTGYLILVPPPLPSSAWTCHGQRLSPWLVKFARARTVMVTGTFAFLYQKRTRWMLLLQLVSEWIDIFQMIAVRFQQAWSFPGTGAAFRDVRRWLRWGILARSPLGFAD